MRHGGFTLIELMIGIAIIAIIAAIAIPDLLSARLHSNETSRYTGGPLSTNPLIAAAAFRAPAATSSITGQLATGTTGRDGNFWKAAG